jgi:hypothetical protein
MTLDVLESTARDWPTTEATPSGIAELLSTSRAAFVLAWFHYEMLVVSAAWSLLAVEGALRDRLEADDRRPLSKLLAQVKREQILAVEDVERLDAARQLRNQLAHARSQQVWTLGMAGPVVATSHRAISLVYPPAATTGPTK